jgi:DNA-binding MarR family transcriptional regulator
MGPAGEQMSAILGAAHSIHRRMESALEAVELSGAKYQALSTLAESGTPLPLSEIANRLACVRSNVTQLVDRLEAEGLVRRVSDPGDRRSVRAELTDSGVERRAAGAEAVAGVMAAVEARISPPERELLQRALAAFG